MLPEAFECGQTCPVPLRHPDQRFTGLKAPPLNWALLYLLNSTCITLQMQQQERHSGEISKPSAARWRHSSQSCIQWSALSATVRPFYTQKCCKITLHWGGVVAARGVLTQQTWCVRDPFSLFLNRLIQSGGNLTRPGQKMDTESSVMGGGAASHEAVMKHTLSPK